MSDNKAAAPLNLQTESVALCMRQWHSLGCKNETVPNESLCIDLEALILFTCVIGRDNIILFDNMIGWLFNHSDLVNTGRLITMVNNGFLEITVQNVIKILEETHLGRKLEKNLNNKNKSTNSINDKEADQLVKTDVTAKSLVANKDNQLKNKNTTFSPNIKELIEKKTLIQSGAATFQLMMRYLVGVSTRAEILAFFAAERGEITASELAKALNYHQSVIFSVLREMVDGGFVIKRTGDKVFYMPKNAFMKSLCTQVGGVPKWVPWLTVYRFLIDVQNLLNDIEAKKYADAIDIDEASHDFLLTREGELKKHRLNRYFPKKVIHPHGGYLEAINTAIRKLLTELTCQPKKSTVKKNKAVALNETKQETAQAENKGSA